jgi:hypothetical protein
MERLLGRKFVKHFGKFLQQQLTLPSEQVGPTEPNLEVRGLEEL